LIGDRISTEKHKEYTTIIISPLKQRFKETLLFAWVLSFSFIGIYLIYVLSSGVELLNAPADFTEEDFQTQKIYLVVFIGFWAYFEYKTLRALLWYKFGMELIKIDREAIHIKRSVLSYGKSNRFFFENIRDFHHTQTKKTSFNYFFENAYWTVGTDSIQFQHFGKHYSFGRKLGDKDTMLLMRFIAERIKKYSKIKVKIVS